MGGRLMTCCRLTNPFGSGRVRSAPGISCFAATTPAGKPCTPARVRICESAPADWGDCEGDVRCESESKCGEYGGVAVDGHESRCCGAEWASACACALLRLADDDGSDDWANEPEPDCGYGGLTTPSAPFESSAAKTAGSRGLDSSEPQSRELLSGSGCVCEETCAGCEAGSVPSATYGRNAIAWEEACGCGQDDSGGSIAKMAKSGWQR